METPIWTFQTGTGSVRLLVGGEDENLKALHESLLAIAAVADDVNQFLELAGRQAIAHGVMIGDILRSGGPARREVDLRAEIRRAAEATDPSSAIDIIKSALRAAGTAEVEQLAADDSWSNERAFVQELVGTFDERADEVADQIVAIVGDGVAALLLGA
jgi:hypothetical protein